MSILRPTDISSDFERRLARLESVIIVDMFGNVQIKAAKNMDIISGASLAIRSETFATVSAPSLSFRADADASLQGATLKLWAMGPAELGGSTLRLNNGSRPIARSGDVVMVAPGGPGTITSGNPKILG